MQSDSSAEPLPRPLQAGTTDLFQVGPGTRAADRTLAELELRHRSGATVVAVVRDAQATLSPPGDFRLRANDVLVIVGSHAQIDAAFGLLAAEETGAGARPVVAGSPP